MPVGNTQKSPSMPELMAQMQDLMRTPLGDLQKDMQAAQALTPIDPSVFQTAVATGGPLSTAQDFASSNAWAMTPEMFKQTIAQRPDINKQAADITSLSDAIFGRTNQRKAAEAVAQANFGSAKDSLSTASRLYEGQQDRDVRQSEGAMDRDTRVRINQASIAAANMRQDKQLALEERKLTALRDSFGSGGVPANTPLVDQKLAIQYGDKAFKYLDKDGKVMPGRSADFWSNRLLEQAYKGAVQDGWVQKMPEGFALSNGKTYNAAVFRRNPAGGSWYGVEKGEDGKVVETREPLLTAWHPAAFGGRGSGGSASRQVPLYAQED